MAGEDSRRVQNGKQSSKASQQRWQRSVVKREFAGVFGVESERRPGEVEAVNRISRRATAVEEKQKESKPGVIM